MTTARLRCIWPHAVVIRTWWSYCWTIRELMWSVESHVFFIKPTSNYLMIWWSDWLVEKLAVNWLIGWSYEILWNLIQLSWIVCMQLCIFIIAWIAIYGTNRTYIVCDESVKFGWIWWHQITYSVHQPWDHPILLNHPIGCKHSMIILCNICGLLCR